MHAVNECTFVYSVLTHVKCILFAYDQVSKNVLSVCISYYFLGCEYMWTLKIFSP